jgi:hypothetical protein
LSQPPNYKGNHPTITIIITIMQDEDETHTPGAQQLSESQEIVVGNSGRAILLGDELADLESVHGHGRSAPYPRSTQKRGACPTWLRSSSPKMKAILGIIAIVLVAFVAVLITGATQLSDDDGGVGSGGGSSLQSDKNVVVSGPGDNTSPAPTPSPTTSKSSSSSSSTPNDSVSSVNILLSDSLESMVPKFADGLNANEQEDWKVLEESIEDTIITAFLERLPEGYTLESVQIEKFDGYDTTSLRQRRINARHLQTNSESGSSSNSATTTTSASTTNAVHAVLYASSITVDCAASDCSTAADIVADITSEISQLEFLEVEDEEKDVVGAEETDAPVGSSSGSPTQSPVTTVTSLSPTTLAPSILVTTIEPTSASPSQAVTNATEGPLPLFIREDFCSVESLCGRCEGTFHK